MQLIKMVAAVMVVMKPRRRRHDVTTNHCVFRGDDGADDGKDECEGLVILHARVKPGKQRVGNWVVVLLTEVIRPQQHAQFVSPLVSPAW